MTSNGQRGFILNSRDFRLIETDRMSDCYGPCFTRELFTVNLLTYLGRYLLPLFFKSCVTKHILYEKSRVTPLRLSDNYWASKEESFVK